MFNKIKENLFKYFGKKKDQPQEENKIKVQNIENINIEVVNSESNIRGFEKNMNNISEVIAPKKEDHKEKLKKKLQLIARNTKSARIRKKNLKRLVNLFGDY